MKGVAVVAVVMASFLFSGAPREVVALAAAGVLLASREMASREMLGLVDWHLLVLFAGLFVVNAAVQQSGLLGGVFMAFRMAHLDLATPAVLFGVTAVLSNLVSNVPAVMLLLPVASHPLAGAGPRAGLDAGRQPVHRRQHRQHHRGGPGAAARRGDRLEDARARRRAGHAGYARGGGGLAGARRLAPASGP